jgi:hypothetical protein
MKNNSFRLLTHAYISNDANERFDLFIVSKLSYDECIYQMSKYPKQKFAEAMAVRLLYLVKNEYHKLQTH